MTIYLCSNITNTSENQAILGVDSDDWEGDEYYSIPLSNCFWSLSQNSLNLENVIEIDVSSLFKLPLYFPRREFVPLFQEAKKTNDLDNFWQMVIDIVTKKPNLQLFKQTVIVLLEKLKNIKPSNTILHFALNPQLCNFPISGVFSVKDICECCTTQNMCMESQNCSTSDYIPIYSLSEFIAELEQCLNFALGAEKLGGTKIYYSW